MDAHQYEQLANEIFYPVYPVIAGQILERTGLQDGRLLDLGCGGGQLGLELAKESRMEVELVDASEQGIALAEQNLQDQGLSGRVHAVRADAASLPYADATFDLVVSRGSLAFWPDQAAVFAEIHRVLRTDGQAIVGGGFGTAQLKRSIQRKMQSIERGWQGFQHRRMADDPVPGIKQALKRAGIRHYSIDNRFEGLWIRFDGR